MKVWGNLPELPLALTSSSLRRSWLLFVPADGTWRVPWDPGPNDALSAGEDNELLVTPYAQSEACHNSSLLCHKRKLQKPLILVSSSAQQHLLCPERSVCYNSHWVPGQKSSTIQWPLTCGRTLQEALHPTGTFTMLDGKHVAIKCPKKSGSVCYNYKGFYLIMFFGLVNADYKFTLAHIGVNGLASNTAMFNASVLRWSTENLTDFPDSLLLLNNNWDVPLLEMTPSCCDCGWWSPSHIVTWTWSRNSSITDLPMPAKMSTFCHTTSGVCW